MKHILRFALVLFSATLVALTVPADAARRARVKLVAFSQHVHMQYPKWSSGATHLGFEMRRGKSTALRIYDVATGKTRRVAEADPKLGTLAPGLGDLAPSRGSVSHELAWAPVGTKYLFSSNGTGSVYDLYLSNEGRLRASSATKTDGQPAWSKDGTRVAFTSARTGKGDIYFFNLTRKPKPKRLTSHATGTELFPVWSPTGSITLAYMAHRGSTTRIRIIRNVFAPMSTTGRLTNWSKDTELNPSWSPDGSKIAFFGMRSRKKEDLYDLYYCQVTRKGARPVLLARDVVKSDKLGPAWSPDGKRIFFARRNPRRDGIFHVAIANRRVRRIATGTRLNDDLAVAAGPGGKWRVAWVSRIRRGISDRNWQKLYRMDLSPIK